MTFDEWTAALKDAENAYWDAVRRHAEALRSLATERRVGVPLEDCCWRKTEAETAAARAAAIAEMKRVMLQRPATPPDWVDAMGR